MVSPFFCPNQKKKVGTATSLHLIGLVRRLSGSLLVSPFESANHFREELAGLQMLLLLKGNRRSAGPLGLEIDSYFNAIGNLYEGNAAVHSILFAVEAHGSLDRA